MGGIHGGQNGKKSHDTATLRHPQIQILYEYCPNINVEIQERNWPGLAEFPDLMAAFTGPLTPNIGFNGQYCWVLLYTFIISYKKHCLYFFTKKLFVILYKKTLIFSKKNLL